jgi:hypothetical protein
MAHTQWCADGQADVLVDYMTLSGMHIAHSLHHILAMDQPVLLLLALPCAFVMEQKESD